MLTIPVSRLGETIGFLHDAQEAERAAAIVLTVDLDLPLLG
ncbi:hypothetical protein [Microbacterium candidum]|uniref:Uncharacterized protein n=1 Tax=Microbacterium candidum TaxID=3041922 RepID=A0ABT7MVJ1_9MICO|nr:hypothetical protein [Microbacterium sp. ASV49]MDL9978475.1 hypothetical protein [Microbacterium sp. ASV49]